jgi:glycosyltransferase involved in cell wall biosynthesis
MTRELRITDRVKFTGFLSQTDLRALFAASHVFVHPSETAGEGDQEGVPNSMLEAMASGLPVVATHHGGIPEAVRHEESGLLVKERDHAAVAAALLRLADHPLLYAGLGAAGSRSVRENFDLRKQTRVLESLYAEVATPERRWVEPASSRPR